MSSPAPRASRSRSCATWSRRSTRASRSASTTGHQRGDDGGPEGAERAGRRPGPGCAAGRDPRRGRTAGTRTRTGGATGGPRAAGAPAGTTRGAGHERVRFVGANLYVAGPAHAGAGGDRLAGCDPPGQRHRRQRADDAGRLVAAATLQALQPFLGEERMLAVQDVARLRMGRRTVVVVAVKLLEQRSEKALTAAARWSTTCRRRWSSRPCRRSTGSWAAWRLRTSGVRTETDIDLGQSGAKKVERSTTVAGLRSHADESSPKGGWLEC